jgi:hypothetical protein
MSPVVCNQLNTLPHDLDFAYVAPDVDRCEVTAGVCIVESERNNNAGRPESRLQLVFVREVFAVSTGPAGVLVFDLY